MIYGKIDYWKPGGVTGCSLKSLLLFWRSMGPFIVLQWVLIVAEMQGLLLLFKKFGYCHCQKANEHANCVGSDPPSVSRSPCFCGQTQ